jgi:hypothetical protein
MKGISLADENALFKYGPQEKDPGVLLLEEVHRTAGIVLGLEDKVKELGGEDLVWSLREETSEKGHKGEDSVSMVTRRYGAEVNTWYQLYKEERKHLAAVASAAIKAGVEERRVRIAERGIDMLEAAMIASFADLGLDPHSARVREVIGRRLAEALGGHTDLFGTDEGHRALEAVSTPYIDAEVVDDGWGKQGPEDEF